MFLGLLIVPFVTWSIAASTVAAMFIRPSTQRSVDRRSFLTAAIMWSGCHLFLFRRIPEAVWACLGAGLLLDLRLIPFNEALGAVTTGYWLGGVAMRTAGDLRARLFTLVYLVGIVVTTVLSNDSTRLTGS